MKRNLNRQREYHVMSLRVDTTEMDEFRRRVVDARGSNVTDEIRRLMREAIQEQLYRELMEQAS